MKPFVNFTDTISIVTHNGPSVDQDEEMKLLKQQLEFRQRELEIKTLEATEPELKIKRIVLIREKCYLDEEREEMGKKEETLKTKKANVTDQIREVNKILMRTYRMKTAGLRITPPPRDAVRNSLTGWGFPGE